MLAREPNFEIPQREEGWGVTNKYTSAQLNFNVGCDWVLQGVINACSGCLCNAVTQLAKHIGHGDNYLNVKDCSDKSTSNF